MPNWFEENAPTPPAAAKGNWFQENAPASSGFDMETLLDPKRRPVSMEDFNPPKPSKGWPAKLGDAAAGLFKSTIGAIPETVRAAADLYGGTLGGDIGAMNRTAERGRAMVGAQADEFRKAGEAGLSAEGVARAVTGAVPLLGPTIGRAADKIGAGDAEGYGEAAGLLAPMAAAKLAPRIPAAAASAAKAVGDVPPVALEIAKHLPVVGGPIRGVHALTKILGRITEMAAPDAPKNVGGRLVKGVGKNVDNILADALEELRQPEPAPSVELPPQPSLPPGYTPRTSAPAPKPAAKPLPAPVAALVKRKAAGSHGPPGYFLRKPAAVAEAAEAVEPGGLEVSDLPTSWRSRVDQPLIAPQGAAGQQLAAEFASELQARGLSSKDAIALVSRNPSLPPMVRLQIVSALKGAQR